MALRALGCLCVLREAQVWAVSAFTGLTASLPLALPSGKAPPAPPFKPTHISVEKVRGHPLPQNSGKKMSGVSFYAHQAEPLLDTECENGVCSQPAWHRD